jgi:hypothetical protein
LYLSNHGSDINSEYQTKFNLTEKSNSINLIGIVILTDDQHKHHIIEKCFTVAKQQVERSCLVKKKEIQSVAELCQAQTKLKPS